MKKTFLTDRKFKIPSKSNKVKIENLVAKSGKTY